MIKHQEFLRYYDHDCRDQIVVKRYVFMLFDKNMGKTFSTKYSQNVFDPAQRRSATVALKTISKRAN